jgi:tetratricopeptide (TPR) repeat protein
LTPENRLKVLSRIGTNLHALEHFEEAIDYFMKVLVAISEEDNLDYLLWCGECYFELEKYETAAMFFNAVIDRGEGEDRWSQLVDVARKNLGQVAIARQ